MLKYIVMCMLLAVAAATSCQQFNLLYGRTAQLNHGITTPGNVAAGGTYTGGYYANWQLNSSQGFWKTFNGPRCIPGSGAGCPTPWQTRTTNCVNQVISSSWDQDSIFWADWYGEPGNFFNIANPMENKPSVQYDLGKVCNITSVRGLFDNNDKYDIYGRDFTTGQWIFITTFGNLGGSGFQQRNTIDLAPSVNNMDSIRVYGRFYGDGYFSIGQLAVYGSCSTISPIVCNDVHYWVEEGQLLDTSLQSPPTLNTNFHDDLATNPPMAQGVPNAQAPSVIGCQGTLRFGMESSPSHHTPSPPGYTPAIGSFEVTGPSGSFKYINNALGIVWNGYDNFTYNATCTSGYAAYTNSCNATAYINVVYTSAASHNRPAPGFGDDYTSVDNRFVKCEGSCETRGPSNTMWYARHELPRLWDMQTDEAGAPIMPTITWENQTFDTDALELEWTYNFAIITTYGTIGNMAARFPTMEEITWKPGQWFSSQDVAAEAANTSTGFDQLCLDNQGDEAAAKTSKGRDVWTWSNLDTMTGSIGPKNTDATSWYQKFGGKHHECDSILGGCRFAPLLTPRSSQNEDTEGVWRISIKNCTTRWQAKFTWNALRLQKLHGVNNSAWKISAPKCTSCPGGAHIKGYEITGNIYNEVVQPNSWTDASRGFSWLNKKYEIKIILEQDTDFKFELGIDIFTVDLQWFRYKNGDEDHSFGYNMIVYPLTLNDLQQSAPDRRITGYKWNSATWFAPSVSQCSISQCSGTVFTCVDRPNSAPGPFSDYTGQFPDANCPEGQARVFLFKGPANTDCTSGDPMHIQGVPGISAQDGCATNFQNITLRGTATGSHGVSLSEGFGFEGTIVLQFLLANGEHPHFQITPKLYVQSLCVRGAFAGTTATCRGSPFWPVPDVSASSTSRGSMGSIDIEKPTGQFYSLPTYLCEEVDARTFGPTDWASILFDIKDVDADLVELQTLYVVFGDQGNRVYFYNDGTASAAAGGTYWLPDYGYLHYRDLKALDQLDLSHPSGMSPPQNMDFGFAFTPGAHNENMKITIYCTLRIVASSATRRFRGAESTKGENTVTESIQINRNFSPALRNGLSLSSQGTMLAAGATSQSNGNTGSSSVIIGVLAALCGVMAVAIGGLILFIVRSGSTGNKPARVNSNVQV